MALFLSQLVLLPILAVFAWMYVRLRPQRAHAGSIVWFDVTVIGLALMFSVAGVLWAESTEIGHASPIWKPILSIITTFHIFPLVLLVGWLLSRRVYSSEAKK